MSRRWPSWHQDGYSLLDMVVAVLLLSLLFLVALDRLLPLRGQAEAATVMENEGRLREGLGSEVAHRALKRGLASLPELAGSNPMARMATPPPHYLGERAKLDPATLPPGAWAFDQSRGVLVYRLRFPEYFIGEPRNPARVEWRIEIFYAANSARRPDDIRGVLLVPLGHPRWDEGN